MDVKAFFDQYLMSVNDCVFDNGAFPNSAPGAPPNDRNDPAYNGWADGGVIIPYNMYIRYGDVGIIERSYDKMVNYIEYTYMQIGMKTTCALPKPNMAIGLLWTKKKHQLR